MVVVGQGELGVLENEFQGSFSHYQCCCFLAANLLP